MASSKSYTLFYHYACEKFYGRAIGILLTLDQAGATYKIEEPSAGPENVGFATPMLTLPSGQTLAQTPAILDVLGAEFDLAGTTQEQKNDCKQCVLDLDDIFDEAYSGKLKENPERAAKWFGLLQARLTRNKFMVCDSPTVADFHGIFTYEWILSKLGEPDAEKYPKLVQWWQEICKVPVVDKMKTGDVVMIP